MKRNTLTEKLTVESDSPAETLIAAQLGSSLLITGQFHSHILRLQGTEEEVKAKHRKRKRKFDLPEPRQQTHDDIKPEVCLSGSKHR